MLHFQLVDSERDPRYEGGRLDQPALKIRFVIYLYPGYMMKMMVLRFVVNVWFD